MFVDFVGGELSTLAALRELCFRERSTECHGTRKRMRQGRCLARRAHVVLSIFEQLSAAEENSVAACCALLRWLPKRLTAVTIAQLALLCWWLPDLGPA